MNISPGALCLGCTKIPAHMPAAGLLYAESAFFVVFARVPSPVKRNVRIMTVFQMHANNLLSKTY